MAFTRVPKQALRGCLANIRTVDGNRLWKPEPTLVMMKLVRDQELRAQCVRKYRENCYGLFINILDDLSEITLNNTLVHMGLAVNETVNKYVGKALVSLNKAQKINKKIIYSYQISEIVHWINMLELSFVRSKRILNMSFY